MKIVHSKGRTGRVIFIKKIQDFRTIFDGGSGSKSGVTKATGANKPKKATGATGRNSPFMKTIKKHVINPYNAAYDAKGLTVPGAYTKRNEERKKMEERANKAKEKQERETERTQAGMESSFAEYNLRSVSKVVANAEEYGLKTTGEELYPGAGMYYDKGWEFGMGKVIEAAILNFAVTDLLNENTKPGATQILWRYGNVTADDPRYFGQFQIRDDPSAFRGYDYEKNFMGLQPGDEY